MTQISPLPSFSQNIKRGAKIKALALVIENPDGELIMVRPDDIVGFHLDVETTWVGPPFTSAIESQVGRLELEFKVLGIMKTRPADVRETTGARPGVWLPGMEFEVLKK